MTSPAVRGEPSALRIVVVDAGGVHDVFEAVEVEGEVARVRSPFLFEIGEELTVRIEHAGAITEARARVRAHAGPPDARVTELELRDRRAAAPPVTS